MLKENNILSWCMPYTIGLPSHRFLAVFYVPFYCCEAFDFRLCAILEMYSEPSFE